MAKGRRAVPSGMKMLRGNPGKRALPDNEPQPPAGVPDPPEHLSAAAAQAWWRFAATLEQMRVLTKADWAALEGLCETYAELKAAGAVSRRYQRVKTKSGGYMWRVHPAVSVRQDADRRFRAWLVEFGLTPAARTKVRVRGEEKPTDPAAKYFA